METVNPTQSKVEALPLLGTTLVCIASRKTPFLFSLHSLIYVPGLQAFSPPSLWELKLKCETCPAGVRGFYQPRSERPPSRLTSPAGLATPRAPLRRAWCDAATSRLFAQSARGICLLPGRNVSKGGRASQSFPGRVPPEVAG